MQWINEYLRAEFRGLNNDDLRRSNSFSVWHVEVLLNQAADILDRCLSEYLLQRSFDERFAHINLDFLDRSKRALLEKKRIETDKVQDREDTLLAEELRVNTALLSPGNNWEKKTDAVDKLNQLVTNAVEKTRDQIGLFDHRIRVQLALADNRNRSLRKEWSAVDAKDSKTDYDNRVENDAIRKDYIESIDGPFNLLSLRDRARERVADDFKRAAARMARAAEGLDLIFQYQEPLPSWNTDNNVSESGALPINDAIKWVRGAISWLIAFTQKDQAFTRCVSVRAANPQAWLDQANSPDPNSMRLLIDVPADLFSGHLLVRLRGLSALAVGSNAGYMPWRVAVTIPREAEYVTAGGRLPITQTLPTCHLGRVEGWETPREPEVCGVLSLLNGSPIGVPGAEGKWEILITRPTQYSENMPSLDDLQLRIHAVGQPI